MSHAGWARKDKLYAQPLVAREAVRQAKLEALAVEHKKRAQKKLHAALARRQKEFLARTAVPI